MAFSQEQFDELIVNRAQEGLYLEFKRGAALCLAGDARRELVKDCIGFANAAGGLLIYGVAEATIDNIDVAAAIDPVPADGANSARISQILRSNTSPPITAYEITELQLPNGAGRVVAIEITAAGTAHQNLLDHRYYQRSGSTTQPMTDFQIRDVMSRRSKPEVLVEPRMKCLLRQQNFHRYLLEVKITNVGMVSLEKWRFELDVPHCVVTDTSDDAMMQLDYEFHVTEMRTDHESIYRIGFGDPHPTRHAKILHPQQSLEFCSRDGTQESSEWYPRIVIEIDQPRWLDIRGTAIPWRMYIPNNAPFTGVWEFDDWCSF